MVICMTGMHRSGTSLMASYLEACGISMGERLAAGTRGNLRGHFEDRDFLDFHKRAMKIRHIRTFSIPKPIVLNTDEAAEGYALCQRKQQLSANWGWKDPRTTMFLDFWESICPKAQFVFLYRDPVAVVDSLLRRGTDLQLKIQPWRAAQCWLGYNRLLLDFHARNSERTSLINIAGFNKHYAAAAAQLSGRIGIKFTRPYTAVYQPADFSSAVRGSPGLCQKWIARRYGRTTAEVYSALEQAALVTEHGPKALG